MEYVGERVDVNGHKGRIMYYGSVEGKPGLYFGIDWEDPKRGRHDGTVDGIRYFQASTPTSGSFVTPKIVSFGEDFMKSFLSHYVMDCDPEGGLISDSRLNRDIEFVQRDRYIRYVQNFDKLFSVSLINSDVKYFKSDDISFPNCTTLILSKSLIVSWEILAKITTLFPILRLLDISHNYMEPLSRVENLESCIHTPKIKTLNADNCGLDNESVRRLFILFRELNELHISNNEFNTVEPPDNYETLEELFIYGNKICKFSNLDSLAKFPRLKYLSISQCHLKDIAINADFPRLETLIIDGNEFSKWEDVQSLSLLPNLKKLTLRCLIPGECGVDNREIIISKLEDLIELDHCDISPIERKNAERQFLLRIGVMRPIAEVHHKDVERLSVKHDFYFGDGGPVEEHPDFITIRFQYRDKWFEKAFPQSMELIRAATLVCRRVGGNPRAITYYIRSNNGVDDPQEITVQPYTLLSSFAFGPDNLIIMVDR